MSQRQKLQLKQFSHTFAGTSAEQLTTTENSASYVMFTAHEDNTGLVKVGGLGVTDDAFLFSLAGSEVILLELELDKHAGQQYISVNEIYGISDTASNKISIGYLGG